MTLLTQNSRKFTFSNSLPCTDLMLATWLSICFCNFLTKVTHISYILSLVERNMVHMDQEWSSIITNTYLFPHLLETLIGQHKSMCNSSKSREVLASFFDLKDDMTCLALIQASQILCSLNFNFGKPRTMSLVINLFNVEKLTCPSILCHRREPISSALRHDNLFSGEDIILA